MKFHMEIEFGEEQTTADQCEDKENSCCDIEFNLISLYYFYKFTK